MYQEYEIPFTVEYKGEVIFSIERDGEHFVYRRAYQEDILEKTLAVKSGRAFVNPIEPLTRPKELTPYLLIMLDRKLMIAPKGSTTVYLKFPIEIGVYIQSKNEFKLVDSFTRAKQKYTLYGDPRQGVICKYWQSSVYPTIPSTDPLEEGVLTLAVSNSGSGWVEVSQIVFNAYGMKIYYDDQKVAMKAKMKISGGNIAETSFVDSPLEAGMKKSIEYYRVSKISITDTTYVMEMGL